MNGISKAPLKVHFKLRHDYHNNIERDLKEHVKLLPEAQHGLTVIPETKSKATHPIPD